MTDTDSTAPESESHEDVASDSPGFGRPHLGRLLVQLVPVLIAIASAAFAFQANNESKKSNNLAETAIEQEAFARETTVAIAATANYESARVADLMEQTNEITLLLSQPSVTPLHVQARHSPPMVFEFPYGESRALVCRVSVPLHNSHSAGTVVSSVDARIFIGEEEVRNTSEWRRYGLAIAAYLWIDEEPAFHEVADPALSMDTARTFFWE